MFKMISQMKKIALPFLFIFIWSCVYAQHQNQARFQPTVLLEMFSSEGCSSCPLADDFMQEVMRIADSTSSPVFLLDYHVDIWDKSGWVDPFSDTLYSKMQLEYMKKAGQPALFTPMLFVNGKWGLAAGNKREVGGAIYQELSKGAEASLTLNASMLNDASGIVVAYNLITHLPNDSIQLVLALALKETKSNVTSGENAGKVLIHHQVVRQVKTFNITEPTGYVNIPIPENTLLSDYALIGYIQNKNTWKIYSCDELSFRKGN
jgi:hypothetical protein